MYKEEFNEYYTEKDRDRILEFIYIDNDKDREPGDNRPIYSTLEKIAKRIINSLEVNDKVKEIFGRIPLIRKEISVFVDILDEEYMDHKFPMLIIKELTKCNYPLVICLLHKYKGNLRLIIQCNDLAIDKGMNSSFIGKMVGEVYDIKMNGKNPCQGGRRE